MEEQVRASVARTEKQLGKKLGDLKKPLLLRFAREAGFHARNDGHDLNLGLNDETVEALATSSGNERFAWDCYRRFIQMYGGVVMGVQKLPGEEHDPFEHIIDSYKEELFPKKKVKLTTAVLMFRSKGIGFRFKALVKKRAVVISPLVHGSNSGVPSAGIWFLDE